MDIKKHVTNISIIIFSCCIIFSSSSGQENNKKRRDYLEQLLQMIPPEKPEKGAVSVLDAAWEDWLERTGELPPDFSSMPSIPFLPDPLILDEGGRNIPVTTQSQWEEKRQWMRDEVKKWITGTFPPKPDNMKISIIHEKTEGTIISRLVELRFGPEHRAKLTIELLIPSMSGKHPVFMTQWNHRGWAQIAVRRGYIGCVYAGADTKDDTEQYADIWYPEYDFTRLMRRAWGAHRAVDYLYTLPFVDTDRIGITGHSRNGKQSLMAAAFDERITAVVSSSGGTGAENPWRYTSEKYDNETIWDITTNFPYWFHPRLRFFIGREQKLPADQNHLMALVAPRGLMLSTAITESEGDPWGIEQVYTAMKPVYDFLNAEDNLAIIYRYGEHGTNAKDIEGYCDFFDYVFGRKNIKPENRLLYDYSFSKWTELSNENINPLDYPVKTTGDILIDPDGKKIGSMAKFEQKKKRIVETIKWGLGEEPPRALTNIKRKFPVRGREDYPASFMSGRVRETREMGVMRISPYSGFGDYLFASLFYPKNKDLKTEKLPAVLFLHEYAYHGGFARRIQDFFEKLTNEGFVVFAYDMLGFGTRVEEGTLFYERYPHWSKMGKMVSDTRAAVDALNNMAFIDGNSIYTCGYSLGGTVGLYAAALDNRITGTVSVCGFTPMRTSGMNRDIEGIRAYSHLHGLLPRLGFFTGNETRIPYDFDGILACIAPRPILITAPQLDRDADNEDVTACVEEVRKVYELYGNPKNITFLDPVDYSHFFDNRQDEVIDWLREVTRK